MVNGNSATLFGHLLKYFLHKNEAAQGLFSEMELVEKMLTERKGFIFQNSKNNRIIHFNIYVVVKHCRDN